ncbi:MAG: O-antigen ligase family protein [Deltaproteobacteria bacterium]|nr:O-antigen ligase family protein [Deltaproteobacteria bacterium]
MSALLFAILLFFPYIDAKLALDLGPWHADAPLADLAALLLAPFGLVLAWRTRWRPPGWQGFAALLAVGWMSAWLGDAAGRALHELLRKVLFSGVVYGLCMALAVKECRDTDLLRKALLLGVGACASISVTTSVLRIGGGDALWWQSIEGLTNNHKTLAVAMAPTLPLLWSWRDDRVARWVVGLGVLALAVSMSRTAWIAAAAGGTYLIQWRGRPLAARPWVVPAIVIVGVLAATFGPHLIDSAAQLDALRSRQSLDKRAWLLFLDNPLLGGSPGASIRYEIPTFPDYRVNGVEAHGVLQKIGGEYGLLGLLAYGWMFLGLARASRGHWTWPCFVALHVNLLLSTETFTQTHWALLGLVLGLAARR